LTNRLTRIYTRTGDDGSTGLADGSRVPKDHLRIGVLGCVDELNSQLGVVISRLEDNAPEGLGDELRSIQNQLFDLGAELAIPGTDRIAGRHVERLEDYLDARNGSLPPLREFILPGGGSAAAQCHLARAVCRRTERELVRLDREAHVNPYALHYLNRLSDLLFVFARVLARHDNGGEICWQPENASGDRS
jgi:cob(I)alamin adenosyltransferase